MKNIILLILFAIQANSASLTLNIAKDKNIDFSILHIKDNEPFFCEIKIDNFKKVAICTFSQNITGNISKSNKDLTIKLYENRLIIIPKNKIILRSLQDDFIRTDMIKSDLKHKHKHWMIIGFKEESELLKNSINSGIDFDIVFENRPLLYVGSLDLNGLPVVENHDATSLSRIKRQFEEKRYKNVLRLTQELIEDKNSKFLQEAKLYKLRALDALAWESGKEPDVDSDELIELANDWMRENPSSKHLPEVLMYISKTYYMLGHISRGDDYFDILKEEFYNSKYTKIAQIHKANTLYRNRGKRAEAMKIYKDVLYNTKNITIASNVASIISGKYLDTSEPDLAYEFYRKVVDANEPYIQKEAKESYEFAKRFSEAKKYDLAIKIVEILLRKKDKTLLEDEMNKNLAYWRELNGDKALAYGLYRDYLTNYPKGEYIEFVKSRIDKVLFDLDDQNLTKKMANIDDILKRYPDDPIYKKALLQKAQLLIENSKFVELFSLENELKAQGGENFLVYGAKKKISQDLKNDNCKNAIYLSEEYNATVEKEFEPKYFDCLMRLAKYKKALKLAEKYQNIKQLEQRADWMHRAIMAHSKLDNNKKVILIAQDLEKLSNILKTDKYDDIIYEKAEAYYNLQDYDEMMLQEVKKIEKKFPENIRNIDLFVKVLRYAKKIKNDSLIIYYAQKIIELQKKYKISDYSPRVELDYIDALKNLKMYDKALDEDLKLLFVKLNDVQRANVLYIAGELSLKTDKPKEAREFFIKCGEIVNDSSWQRLCAENLKLLDE